MRKPIDENLKDIGLRYRDMDDTQIQKDISYLFMAIRQKEFDYKLLEDKYNEQQIRRTNISTGTGKI